MPDLTALLARPVGHGYPTEYLTARVRGRRARLAAGALRTGTETAMPADRARRRMRQEFRWAYGQMNREMRVVFAPLILWFELGTILTCLRFRRGGDRDGANAALSASLLAPAVRQALTGGEGPPEAAAALGALLTDLDARLRDLGTLYRDQGGRMLEQRLATLFLERMGELPLHPLVAAFFRALTDVQNLVTLAKQIRWDLREPRSFIRGGTIAPERLERARDKGTGAGLTALLASLPGMGPLPADTATPGPLLLRWLTGRIRAQGRDPLGPGLILDYLWRCAVEARNQGLICRFGEAEDELRGELIR